MFFENWVEYLAFIIHTLFGCFNVSRIPSIFFGGQTDGGF